MASGQTAPSLSTTIAEFVHASGWRDLPGAVLQIARQHLLDTIGCCLAATKVDTSRLLRTLLLAEGGTAQATAIGMRGRLPVPQAAFMNGLLARSLEFDDMAMPDLHPAGVVVPTVLAASEYRGSPGTDVIAGIALGLELCMRIGWAGFDSKARTSRFLQRGQDSSSICGAVAGAAVAAKVMGLDAKGISDAIGIAVSLAAGSLESNRTGGTIKRFQIAVGRRSLPSRRRRLPVSVLKAPRRPSRDATGSINASSTAYSMRRSSPMDWAPTGECRACVSSPIRRTTTRILGSMRRLR